MTMSVSTTEERHLRHCNKGLCGFNYSGDCEYIGKCAYGTKHDLPATGGQLNYITLLCMELGIKETYEEHKLTRGEAGIRIRDLKKQLRIRGNSNN